ncbi:hypothetical protein DH2020_035892 [Rehmannia glutinosa]|uniref:Uncharacterized protein n=1 Tax=Rehmannia glutinosa TaxID=99300 RepID=A0ABR0V6D8_REHGL
MMAKLSPRFDIPEELLEVLPSDPFEQLDVARKITSIALSTRVDALESEVSVLREQLADRDDIISGLESQLESLDASLNEASDKLAVAQQEKVRIPVCRTRTRKLDEGECSAEQYCEEAEQGCHQVRSLQKDTHAITSREDEDNPVRSAPKAAAPNLPSNNEDDVALPPNAGGTETEAIKPRASHGLLLASQTSTPRLTPPGSPPSLSASVSPSRTPKPLSPRRHSISFSTTRGLFDDRSSVFSSMP